MNIMRKLPIGIHNFDYLRTNSFLYVYKTQYAYQYVFEFKMDDNATAEDAIAQINSKDYAIPYVADHRKLVKIGVEFSQTEKGVKRWLIE